MNTDLENIQLLLDRFKRPIPDKEDYKIRLAEEFELILNQRFTDYFLQICDIIDITEDLTHMTRGSAGSSLVCYLLGITDVDPIKWNIPVARFMNPLRDDLPDVDIDFQHWRQGEVMNRIFKKKNSFKGKIGIFDIKDNKINHRLNFYKIEDQKLIEIF